MLSSFLVLLPFLVGINAANDWSVPCTSGSCSYDLPASDNAPSGSFKIWGSSDAITDITTAADWQILDCNSTALSQDIRLVCMNDPDDPNSNCGHLYQNIGAVNKIVRLPQNCGASAFARISKAWVPTDQSIPSSVQARLVRRGNATPIVKALSIDTNFAAADYSKTGPVNIAIQGANVPGTSTDVVVPGSNARRTTRMSRRGLGGLFGGIASGIDNAAGDIKSAAQAAGNAITSVAVAAATNVASVAEAGATDVKNAATQAASAAEGVATKAESAAKGAATKAASAAKNAATKVASAAKTAASDAAAAASSVANKTIDVSKTFTLPDLTFDKNANLFSKTLSCGPASLSLSADVDGNADMQVILNVAALGTIVPPKFTKFSVVAMMSGTAGGTVDLNADLSGELDSGQIQLVNLGIPGLDFPGILTIGPSFTVDAQLTGTFDINMDMNVGVNLDLTNATIAFPPDSSTSQSAFTLGDTPLSLSATPSVQATGTITAHLIPSLNLGVSALGGKGDAQIFLAVDTSASLTMNLDATAGAEKDIDPEAGSTDDDSASADNSTVIDDGSSDNSTATDDGTDDTTDDGTDDSASADNSTVIDDGSSDNSTATDDGTDDTSDDGTDDSASADNSTVIDDGSSDNSTATDDGTDDTTDDGADDVAADDGTDDTADGTDDTADDGTDTASADNSTVIDDGSSDNSTATDDGTDDATDDGTDDSTDDSSIDDSASADNSTATDDSTDDGTDDSASADNSTVIDDGSSDNSTATDDGTDDSTDDGSDSTTTITPPTLGGCVNVAGNINVNVGADGSFFGLFDKSASKSLFSKDFQIFNKCFGSDANTTTSDNSTATDDGSTDDTTNNSTTDDSTANSTADATDDNTTTRRRRFTSYKLQRRGLSCPVGGSSTKKTSITSGTVKASSIKVGKK